MKLYRCAKCRGEFPASAFYADRTAHTSPVARYCKECEKKINNAIRRKKRIAAIEYKGGKCEKCGYNNFVALDFHHPNPSEKDHKLNMTWSWERIKKEIDRCQLLCANCHREAHGIICA